MKVSLREIAEKTGLSRMAVSLALRGKPGVSEANRKRVLKVAGQMGYEPDPQLSKMLTHLRSSSSKESNACLALLTSGPTPQAWKLWTTEKNYVQGVKSQGKTYGYRVEEFWVNEPGMKPERLANILWSRGIEGVILAPLLTEIGPESLRRFEMDFSRFSVVEISETITWPDLDRSLHDQYSSMQQLLRELRGLGYQRIGFVIQSGLTRRVNGKWTAAYLEDGLVHPETQLSPLVLETADLGAFKRWMKGQKPDVIISVDRFGKKLLESAGLKIPKDMAYASLDLDGVDPEHRLFSGIDQNSTQTGAAAVDLLVSSIQQGKKGIPLHPRRVQVEGSWIPGPSTPSKRQP